MANQDQVQIRIGFITDESKAFANTINDTKKFQTELQSAQGDMKKLSDEMKKLAEAGKSTAETEKKLAEAEGKVNENLQKIVNSAKEAAKVDMTKLLPSQLSERANQLKFALKWIPESHPERLQMQTDFDAIKHKLEELNGASKTTENAMNQMRSVTGTIAAIAAGYFSLRSIISSIFKASDLSSQFEQAQIAFETMLNSESKARKLVKEIQVLAAATPFETAELTDYTKRLLAMGIDGDKVIATMTHLGDIAAGVGREKLPQLVLAFGQVSTETKLTGKEMRQFSEAGVPLIAELAKQFNVAESEISKMTKTGQIKFKDVEKAIESMTSEGGKFAGLMQKQSLTTQGLLSTLKDNIDLLYVSFGDGFNIAFKEMLKSLINFTNGLDREKIKAFGESVGNLVKMLFDFGPTLLKIVSLYVAYNAGMKIAMAYQAAITALQWAGIIPIKAETKAKLELAAATKLAAKEEEELASAAKKAQAAWSFYAVAIAAVIESAIYLYQRMTELTEGQKAIAEATAEASHAIKDEIQTSTDLFGILKDVTTSYEQKHAAVQKIMQLYPSYLGDIKTENDLLANLEVAQQRVNEKIIEEGLARVKAAKIQEFANELLETNIAIAKEQAKDGGGYVTNEDGTTQIVTLALDGLVAKQKTILDKAKDFSKSFEQTAGEVAHSMASMIQTNTSQITEEIDLAYNELQAAADRNDDAGEQAAQKRINKLESQKDKIIAETVDLGNKKKGIAENNEKAEEKAEKERLKRVKEAMGNELEEQEIYFKTEQLVNEYAHLTKQKDEKNFEEDEIRLNVEKYQTLLKIFDTYKHAFKEGSKEFKDIELKELEEQKKLIEARAKIAPRNTKVTDGLTSKNVGSNVTEDTKDTEEEKLKAKYKIELALAQQNFGNIVFQQMQFEDKIAEIKARAAKDEYNLRVKLNEEILAQGKEFSQKDITETQRLLDAKTKSEEDYDATILKNKKRALELEAQMNKLKQKLASDTFNVGIELLSADETARKKNAGAIKAFEIGQITVNSALEIQGIWTQANLNALNTIIPGYGTIVAGIETGFAVARTAAAISKVSSAQFAQGGFTGYGGLSDSTGFAVRGVVHEGEYVVPEKIVKNPKFAGMISNLEYARLGYSNGGYVNTTPINFFSGTGNNNAATDTSRMEMLLTHYAEKIDTWQKDFTVQLPLLHLEKEQKKLQLNRGNASL